MADLQPGSTEHDEAPPEALPEAQAVQQPSSPAAASGWTKLRRGLAPRLSRGQLVAGVLCALLGFGLVAQVRQTNSDDLAGLSQEELVRLFDEVTQRTDALEEQAAALRAQRAELVSGADSERAAVAAAAQRAEVQGILAGTLPAEGGGVKVVVGETDQRISAVLLLNLMEELRNAGAEAIQVGDRRITASSYVIDTVDGVMVDGVMLSAPYVWLAIGDPDTLIPALQVPGGALSSLQARADATTDVEAVDHLTISVLRDVKAPQYATPAPSASPTGD
ncbi:DUF881 domain-containing protein [Actinotalea sp. M2MS4P-6]|uniref:DUF881 domain-containing protein n=1 Tax=Actinotalea sp. M2MS4P-6 TaxID=2983762 RepID=UPI0021E4AE34|nr:DUF881 domain-containing protein [Actinotalea sp. M2MS4P-6]MCV2394631.1 DUF881 domain-containing protein [Actinotalea sp. M2MS4P-6]